MVAVVSVLVLDRDWLSIDFCSRENEMYSEPEFELLLDGLLQPGLSQDWFYLINAFRSESKETRNMYSGTSTQCKKRLQTFELAQSILRLTPQNALARVTIFQPSIFNTFSKSNAICSMLCIGQNLKNLWRIIQEHQYSVHLPCYHLDQLHLMNWKEARIISQSSSKVGC